MLCKVFIINKVNYWIIKHFSQTKANFNTLASGKPILINHKGWQKELIDKKNIGYVLPLDINDIMVKDFVEYSQNKMLITKQKENAFNVGKLNYATNIAVNKYDVLIKNIFANDKK